MILENRIKELLEIYDLVVLKGINIKEIDSEISKLINKDSKMQYYYENIFNKKRRVIYYDEYLILKEFLRGSSNNNIAILINNIYINYYPLTSSLNKDVLEVLIKNDIEDNEIKYSEELSLDKDIKIYTTIYSSVIELDNKYYCIYNEDIDNYNSIEEIKEEYFNLYVEEAFNFEKNLNKRYQVIEIVEETDYLYFFY